MAKPIRFTGEIRESILRDFAAKLDAARMGTTGFKYEKSAQYEDGRKATVVYSSKAWFKTIMLVETQPKEVGWHGVCYRDEDNPNEFYIEDIIIYPQKVTGTTITPDPIEYTNWMNKLDDNTFNHLRFHGHSHVNMAVFSSGTDEAFRNDRMSQLKDDDFYVFQVFNKKGEIHSAVYDYKNNTLYENADVATEVECDSMDIWDSYKAIALLLRKFNGELDNLQAVVQAYDESDMGNFLDEADTSVTEDKIPVSSWQQTGTKKSSKKGGKSKSAKDDIVRDPFGVWDGYHW